MACQKNQLLDEFEPWIEGNVAAHVEPVFYKRNLASGLDLAFDGQQTGVLTCTDGRFSEAVCGMAPTQNGS